MKLSNAPRSSATSRSKATVRSRTRKPKAVAADHDGLERSDYEIRSVTKALDLLEAICDDDIKEQGGSEEEVRITQLS